MDFAGSAEQVSGPLNTNLAVTTSAVFYVIASLVGREIPANRGMMDPVRIRAPIGSVVNCRFPAAVAGGNVETSQRIVDVLLRALAGALPGRIPAASCGTMLASPIPSSPSWRTSSAPASRFAHRNARAASAGIRVGCPTSSGGSSNEA